MDGTGTGMQPNNCAYYRRYRANGNYLDRPTPFDAEGFGVHPLIQDFLKAENKSPEKSLLRHQVPVPFMSVTNPSI